jgi:hypothetical protein
VLLTLYVTINSFSHFSTDISFQGATLISGYPENVREVYKQIPGSQADGNGFYIFPCNTVIPDIAFYFDGVAFPITQNFNRGVTSAGSPYCYGSIMGDQPDNIWTLGTAFMANFYTVFDVGTKRVGFATLAAAPDAEGNERQGVHKLNITQSVRNIME